MLSSAAGLTIAHGSSPDPRTDDRVGQPLRPLLVGGEDVPDEVDRRAVLDGGGAEIAADEVFGRGRGAIAICSCAAAAFRLCVERPGEPVRRALDRHDRHRRAAHAGVGALCELLRVVRARRQIARGLHAAAERERRRERERARTRVRTRRARLVVTPETSRSGVARRARWLTKP